MTGTKTHETGAATYFLSSIERDQTLGAFSTELDVKADKFYVTLTSI